MTMKPIVYIFVDHKATTIRYPSIYYHYNKDDHDSHSLDLQIEKAKDRHKTVEIETLRTRLKRYTRIGWFYL